MGLYTNCWPRTRHVNHIRLQGDHNNNKMEGMKTRLEIIKRQDVFEEDDILILKGYEVYITALSIASGTPE